MSIVHTQLAYWVLRYIEQQSSLSSSAVHCRIGRGGGGGGLKHISTVHPAMFRAGAVCGGLGHGYFLMFLND